MRTKAPLNSLYLDNSDKCKILQAVLIKACLYYIDKVDQNNYGLGKYKVNLSFFYYCTTGVHSDISNALDMIEKLKSHVDAQSLKPLLKTIPKNTGNFYEASLKVILARSLFEIINMDKSSENKTLFDWNDPRLNANQLNRAVNEITEWIDGSVCEDNYKRFLDNHAFNTRLEA